MEVTLQSSEYANTKYYEETEGHQGQMFEAIIKIIIKKIELI